MKSKMLLIIILILLMIILLSSDFAGQRKIYDCNYSEINPDFPQDVKDECRRLRHEQWEQEKEWYHPKKIIRT